MMANSSEITEEEVAEKVYEIHNTLDSLKSWSMDMVRWLEREIEQLEAEGDAGRAESAAELMALVHTVYRRLVESEEDSLIPLMELR